MNYKLSCISSNPRHTVFNLFDRGEVGSSSATPACCGTVTILTSDLVYFLQRCWKGDIFWNGLCPDEELAKQLGPGTARHIYTLTPG